MKSIDTPDVLVVTVHFESRKGPSAPQGYEVAILPTDPASMMSRFPKSAKLHLTTISYCDGRPTAPYISGNANLVANGVNGGVNETGAKRLHTVIKAAYKANIEVVYQASASNSYPTLAEALHALNEA